MNFQRAPSVTALLGVDAYSARAGVWNFMVLLDGGKWSVSYRLHAPKGRVSASSTIMGPFEEFSDATQAAEEKFAELRRLA